MDNQDIFKESLQSLIAYAKGNDFKLEIEDIKNSFKDFKDNETVINEICAYLESEGIKINNYEIKDNVLSFVNVNEDKKDDTVYPEAVTSNKEKKFVEMYLNELKELGEKTPEDIEKLAESYLSGDANAKDELITSCLSLVSIIAADYDNKGLTSGDVLSEGNMGLIEGVSTYVGGSFINHITNSIKKSIERAIEEECMIYSNNQDFTNKMNKLDELSKELTNDDKAPSTSALAKAMNLSEDEITIMLKEAMKALYKDEESEEK